MIELRSRLGFMKPHVSSLTGDLEMPDVLTPAECLRWRAYSEEWVRRGGDGLPAIADLNQNLEYSGFSGNFPTMTRHMILYEFSRRRLITSREMFLSQGHPVLPVPGLDLTSRFAWSNAFGALTRKDRLSLLGNGMHMSSVGAFFLFVLSQLIHVDHIGDGICFNFVGASGSVAAADDDDAEPEAECISVGDSDSASEVV